MTRKQAIARALYAKEWAAKNQHSGAAQDAEVVLSFARSSAFDAHDLLGMAAYQTVLRIWSL